MKLSRLNLSFIICAVVLIYYFFFTFYNLNWGAPYYFHPDERNIASSVNQLKLGSSLHPNFFAYGQLPIYIVYFVGLLINFPLNNFTFQPNVHFETAIIIGRFISAILSIGLIYLIYKVAKLTSGTKTATLSVILASTSVAFLQFSHFGTFEIWLSFFSVLSCYFYLLFLNNGKKLFFVLGACALGLLTALKLSSVVLIIIPFGIVIYETYKLKNLKARIFETIMLVYLFLNFFILAYIISAPFNLIDPKSFLDSMKYEREVALGTLQVFYTGAFFDKIPFIFQYEKILPFLINPLVTLLSIPAILGCIYYIFKRKNIKFTLILLFFLILFISTSVLFVKWTRYLVPSLPFLYILIAAFIVNVIRKFNKPNFTFIIIIFSLIGVIFSFSFIKTARIDTDTRLLLENAAVENIEKEASIISEVYDMGIVPLNSHFSKITLFNFYDLEHIPTQTDTLNEMLQNTDYIVLPSQRIYKSRTLDPKNFPKGNKFYTDLFQNKLGFIKIYETPCDLFCRLAYANDPVFNVEETANVFDRPTVYIFKKVK